MDIDEALPGTEDCIHWQRAVPPKPEAPPVMPRVRLTGDVGLQRLHHAQV